MDRTQRKAVIDAAAVAAYHVESDVPVSQALLCDKWHKKEAWLTAFLNAAVRA